jgi:hypothetical protein
MKTSKIKWPFKQLMVMRQCRLLRKWLRYAENLKATEEEMIDHCWPETGKSLDDCDDEEDKLGSSEDLIDCQEGSGRFPNGQMGQGTKMRSTDDLKDCQEGREEIPDYQAGNGLRSAEDLTDCHEDSQGISHFQLGDDQRSLRDLKYCREGSRSIEDFQRGSKSVLNFQVGRNEQLRLYKSLMDSEKSSVQQEVLMKMGSVDLIVCQEGSRSIPYCQVGRDE